MDESLIRAAKKKFLSGKVPGDLAVVFDRETGGPGLDGRRFRFVAVNANRAEYVEAELTGSNGGSPWRVFDPQLLEAAVERRIFHGCYRPEWLMDELLADDPLSLCEEDFRPHPPRDEAIFF